jgi:hypothetical protein
MYRIAFSTLCTVLLSSAALAVPATQSTAPTPSAQAPVQLADSSRPAPVDNRASGAVAPAEKKICRLLPSSYSRMNDRVCLTKEEWKQVDEQTGN